MRHCGWWLLLLPQGGVRPPPVAPLSDQDLQLLLSQSKEAASSLAEDLLAQLAGPDLLGLPKSSAEAGPLAAQASSSSDDAAVPKSSAEDTKDSFKVPLLWARLLTPKISWWIEVNLWERAKERKKKFQIECS